MTELPDLAALLPGKPSVDAELRPSAPVARVRCCISGKKIVEALRIDLGQAALRSTGMSKIRVCDTMTIAGVTYPDDAANKGDQVEPQQALVRTVFRDWAEHLTIEVAGSRLSSEQFDVALQSRTLAPDLHGVDLGPRCAWQLHSNRDRASLMLFSSPNHFTIGDVDDACLNPG